MKRIFTLIVLLSSLSFLNAQTYHPLATSAFSQNWTNTALISVNDDWSGIPSIIGYRGDDVTSATGTSPDTLLRDGTITIDVIANQNAPNTNASGGVAEFEITNPVIALQGSGTADAPSLVVYLNTTGRSNITFSCLLRDVDGSADNAIQPIAFQYRIGNTGDFINIPSAFVADASSGPNLATLETVVSFILPAACNNQSQVQIRIITSNAAGSDEWIGIDDINVTQGDAVAPLNVTKFLASLINNKVALNWNTTNEINVDGFSIEKSNDGRTFSNIGFVAAKNAASANYSFNDVLAAGVNYYRLKITDKDGSFKYSSVVAVNAKQSTKLDIFPNPVVNTATLSHTKAGDNATVKLITIDGKTVLTQNIQAGATQSSIDVSKLIKGNYLVVFENDGNRTSLQFVKQ